MYIFIFVVQKEAEHDGCFQPKGPGEAPEAAPRRWAAAARGQAAPR